MVSDGGLIFLSSISWRSSRFDSACKPVATGDPVGCWEYELWWCDSSFPEEFHRVWIVEGYGTCDNPSRGEVV